MKKLIIVAAATLAAIGAVEARTPNYNESKVGSYTLEDPLSFADGRKLSSPAEWPLAEPRYLAYSPRRCTAWNRLRPKRS